ncbi:genetic competence negative regulator [Neobacillus notoginsengisoli]|uniref:Genetic competence negative regulator n=1 Tax=Neobacillus notoginsengisoli TaxID=1578198 RepID=A0A417YV98_9BACI|nr:genetic competence negative regulator [Neobacillus notoginsengisoli]RHW41224.1 genetic competence negative regulator [Neobacillus notoginsengisoli]
MRLERLTANKIKIFITSDDLFERGLSKEDIMKDSLKWRQLFQDMLQEASEELEVEIQGSVAVEVFSLQAQGMVLIITVNAVSDEEDHLYDGFIEMQVTVEGYDKLLFQFETIENVIQLAKRLSQISTGGGSLYFMNGLYYMVFDAHNEKSERNAAIMAEYGHASILSPYMLEEYGNLIIQNKAVEIILQHFN